MTIFVLWGIKKGHHIFNDVLFLAEKVGFEPTVPLPVHHLSRVANSTTLAPLR